MEINFSVVFWTIFNFFALMFALNFVLYRPIFRFMHGREERINGQKKAGRNAEIRLDDLKAESEKLISEARREAAKRLDSAREEARKASERMIADQTEAARREHARKLEQLAKDEESDEARLSEIRGSLASMIADKVTENRA